MVHRHLVLFEVEVRNALLQRADEQVAGELILIRKAGGGDGLEAREVSLVGTVLADVAGEGVVVELVIVAVVAVGRGHLGRELQVCLVLLLEQLVLGRDASRGVCASAGLLAQGRSQRRG